MSERRKEWADKRITQYHSIHYWVKKRLPKTEACSWCGNQSLRIELANLSGDYKKEVSDFVWICVSCHKKYDGVHELQKKYADEKWATIQFCKNGHDLQDNYYDYIMKDGRHYRECKTCNKERTRVRRAKNENSVASNI